MSTKSLDDAATAFADDPNYTTAKAYERLALDYFVAMVITAEELDNILSLVMDYLS